MFNPHTLVAARLLDRDAGRPIGRRFFARRLERALRLRERLFELPYYRFVHAEADGLPGLVVDRFAAVLVVQLNAAGIARFEPLVLEALGCAVGPEAIVLRNDSPARALEGLAAETRVASGQPRWPGVGRARTAPVFRPIRSPGRRPAGSSISATTAGSSPRWRATRASSTSIASTAVLRCRRRAPAPSRSSASTVPSRHSTLAAEAAARNGVGEPCRFHRGEAFAEAARLAAAGERFDIVIADPPAFAKSRKEVPGGIARLSQARPPAAALTASGGILFLASCSYNVGEAEFAEAVRRGLADAGRGARILRAAGADADHPIHPALPETAYLKTLTLALD